MIRLSIVNSTPAPQFPTLVDCACVVVRVNLGYPLIPTLRHGGLLPLAPAAQLPSGILDCAGAEHPGGHLADAMYILRRHLGLSVQVKPPAAQGR